MSWPDNLKQIIFCQSVSDKESDYAPYMDKKDRLKWARENAGYATASDAAKAMGMPPPTYLHYENGTNGFLRHAEKFARFYRVNVEWLMTGRGDPRGKAAVTRDVVVKSSVSAGMWTESAEWPEEDWQRITIPYERAYEKYELHACEVQGNSMDLIFPPGTLLIWLSIYDSGEELKDGKPYIIRRMRASGEYETTCKIARNIEGDWFLYPKSSDPQWRPWPAQGLEGDEVVVLGRVIRAYHSYD